jgi:choline dehydrogenase
MLPRIVVSLCFAIAVQARPRLGRTAKIIDARQLTNATGYDFIIAGGGIAGLTVADRLSENPDGMFIILIMFCRTSKRPIDRSFDRSG